MALEWLKKSLSLSLEARRSMVSSNDMISVSKQCELLGVSHSGFYYQPAGESPENLELMRCIDEAYTRWPFYGSRRMVAHLQTLGLSANRKRVQLLMRLMGIEAIYPKPRTTLRHQEHKVFPYLLRNVAIMDWFSRYVLSWRLSNTMDMEFCLEALDHAFKRGERPDIFNSDQGVHFTSPRFTNKVLAAGAQMSMDGKGRAIDNIYIERLWRSVKYEEVYLKDYNDPREADKGLEGYFEFYNHQRHHQALDYQTPAEVFYQECRGADLTLN